MQHFTFCTWMIHLKSIEHNYMYMDLKVSDLQANTSLAQLVRHWTPKPDKLLHQVKPHWR